MAGIMSLFSNLVSGTPAPAANQNPAQPAGSNNPPPGPGQIPAGAPNSGAVSDGAAPNGTLPAAGAKPGDPTPATPFDSFKELWKTDPADPNAPPAGVFGNIDPAKFMEAAGKIDFSKVVTPEQLQEIAAGGEKAVAAFAGALNKVAQGVYAQSAFATTKIVEQALNKSKTAFLAELPQHIKRQQVADNLRTENPIFSNPAVQPIISALEAQMTLKFPNASATEITTMAKQYVEALGTSFAPKPPAPQGGKTKGGKEEMDWEKFLTS